MKKKHIKNVFGVVTFFFLFSICNGDLSGVFNSKMIKVYAQQDVQYTYDSLGRVVFAIYPDGTVVKYEYDRNGNMLSSTIQDTTETEKPGGGGETTENPGQTGGTTEKPGSSGGTTTNPGQAGETTEKPGGSGGTTTNPGQSGSDIQEPVVSTPHNTAKDIKIYNAFKKKKPVIKSLKTVKKKSKRYLKIQIRKVGKKVEEMENKYQIKYATNSKFKKSKTVTVDKKNQKTLTSKQWKVKKGKTYYVKVRACMKTKTGKNIYTKYSKTKKIAVK